MPNTVKASGQETAWNVLTSPWLEVMNHNGETQFCSPLDVLDQAKGFRCIASGSPLDLFAAHRFLLTLLYWQADKAGGVDGVRDSLLNGEMLPSVLEAIKKQSPCFSLFDDKRPFLQDPDLHAENKSSLKSAGSLFAEFATGTNIAHFHHGDDKDMRLCLRCATIGLLRLVPWSQAGGQGKRASIHKAPPIMAIASGKNLAITLGLNLVPLTGDEGEAKWSGHFHPSDVDERIPYLEAFTWNPRRVRLSAPEDGETCWGCGRHGITTVGAIAFRRNDATKSREQGGKTIPFMWKDPAAFYSHDETKNYNTSTSTNEELAAEGGDLRVLIGGKDNSPPQSAIAQENQNHGDWHLIVPCTHPRWIKTFDCRKLALSSLAPETIRSSLPDRQRHQQQGLNGWRDPGTGFRYGAICFVQAAASLIAHAGWTALSNAAYRKMHESPAAFDMLTGLLWGLRNREIQGLPSRDVAWLVLKLMASVPSRARMNHGKPTFDPLQSLPKRQLKELREGQSVQSKYPVSFPRGRRLEAELRNVLEKNIRGPNPERIDWADLCHGLNQLLD